MKQSQAIRYCKRCFIVIVLLGVSNTGWGQIAGDYRSAASGNWNANATWQSYNGTTWIAAVATPNDASGVITIQNGHTVTVTANVQVDQVIVNAGGQVHRQQLHVEVLMYMLFVWLAIMYSTEVKEKIVK